MAVRAGYPLHYTAGQIHDMDVRLVVPEIGQEERVLVARRVLADEERVGGEGAADGAEAAELVGRQPQQDVEQQVRGQHAGVGGGAQIGWKEARTTPATPSTKLQAARIEIVMLGK